MGTLVKQSDEVFTDDSSYMGPSNPFIGNKENLSDGENSVTASSADGLHHMDHKEKLSPIQNIMQYRTPSPTESSVSRSSKKSMDSSMSGRGSLRFEVDYGKFYKTSFLKEEMANYKRGPSINPTKENPGGHYHMPENFSYRKVRTDFTIKKDGTSMMTALGDNKYLLKRGSPRPPLNNKEPIQLSKFPDGQKIDNKVAAVDRDDWPAPPDPAAAYPEILREKPRRRRGGGGSSIMSGTETEGETTATELSEDEMDEQLPLDPKIQREINELMKMGDSGAASALLEDFKRSRAESPTLDPRSASRVPAADHEPAYKTRYISPIFASPSRDLEYRSRLRSMDDLFLSKKYRTSYPVSTFPVPKPGYGLAGKSSSGRSSQDTSARELGYFSDTGMMHVYRRPPPPQPQFESDKKCDTGSMTTDDELARRSLYSSQSSIEEYDPTTGLRRSKLRSSKLSEASSTSYQLGIKRSVPSLFHSEEPAKIYSYEQLKITNIALPPDTDINSLERNLSKEEFESIFHLTHEEFYRLAEWKRNDMKRRVELF